MAEINNKKCEISLNNDEKEKLQPLQNKKEPLIVTTIDSELKVKNKKFVEIAATISGKW